MGVTQNTKDERKKKVQIVAQSYYSRLDVQNAIYKFCKNREIVPNFNNEYFGKRPDCLDYPSDIFTLVKKGATSFHCSEEIWTNPLDINTDMTPEQYNEIKQGWDFLIDIDSKFLDYSKIAARLLLEQLEKHGVNNVGIKFSGSKGFHMIVPFKAFPEKIGEDLTKDKFPEWPRYIAGYLFSLIREPMNLEILRLTGRDKLEETGELTVETVCPKCKKPIERKVFFKYLCPDRRCKGELESPIKKKTPMLCPSCNAKMDLVGERKINFCKYCKISTVGEEIKKSDMEFKEEKTIKSTEDAIDVVLVSSRHLFRAPYSLHEKTAFVSKVLDIDEIDNFKPTDADVLKVKEIRSFMPNSKPCEAKNLLERSIEWGRKNQPVEAPKKFTGKSIDLKGLTISENMFPPVIKKLLKGIKSDGRKRALSVLVSFFSSLDFPEEYLTEKFSEWNKKNYKPLKEGYIRSQISWGIKNKRMPPNYDKPIYKELGVFSETAGVKNPINFTIREALRAKAKKGKNGNWSASVRKSDIENSENKKRKYSTGKGFEI